MRKANAGHQCKDEKPGRALVRPEAADWGHDELMTLAEAAAVFWPKGPLTTTSLRTAVRDGQLATAVIAGKVFTCPRAIREMAVFERRAEPQRRTRIPVEGVSDPPPADSSDPSFTQDRLLDDHSRLKAAVSRIAPGAGGRPNGGRLRSTPRHRGSAKFYRQP